MKNLIFLLFSMMSLYIGAQTITPHRSYLVRQVYNGDTIDVWMSADTVYTYTNQTAFKFNKPIILTGIETLKRKLVSITSANILAGDSIRILPAPGSNLVDIVTNISGLLTHGTTYTKTGTDTTWVYSYNGTTKVKLTYLLDDFILNTATSVGYSPILSPNISLNKPIWIKLAAGFADGTGTLKLVLYYKTENFN